jgi:hypothetical protein
MNSNWRKMQQKYLEAIVSGEVCWWGQTNTGKNGENQEKAEQEVQQQKPSPSHQQMVVL